MRYHRANPAVYYIVGAIAESILVIYSVVALGNRIATAMGWNEAVSDSSTVSQQKVIPWTERDAWALLLINADNPLPEGYEDSVELTELKGNILIDDRIYNDLQQMMDDCREQELNPLILNGYRTRAQQQELFQSELNKLTISGYSLDNATIEAQKKQPLPGCSEHNAGLAVDIVPEDSPYLTQDQEETGELQWIMDHCHEYGFVMRYPADKTEITGMRYQPWHYRYVGRDAAAYMTEHHLCLEELQKAIKNESL